MQGCVLAARPSGVPQSLPPDTVLPRAALLVIGVDIYISLSLNVLKTISNDIARAIQVCCCSRRPASTQQRLGRTRPIRPGYPESGTLCPPLLPGLRGRAAVVRSSVRASAHWFNSSAQTCCGQPVRPLILFSPGPRAGGKPSCCCCQRTCTEREARETGLNLSAPVARAQWGRGKVLGAVTGSL